MRPYRDWQAGEALKRLVFPGRVIGMPYDEFDRLLSETLAGQTEESLAGNWSAAGSGRWVRYSLEAREGEGYIDFFRISESICLSITDAQFSQDTWIGIAGGGVTKLRLLVSGTLLTKNGDVMSRAGDAFLYSSPFGRDTSAAETGYFMSGAERVQLICLHCKAEQFTDGLGIKPDQLPRPFRILFDGKEESDELNLRLPAAVMQATRSILQAHEHVHPDLCAPYLHSLIIQILILLLNELKDLRDRPLPLSVRQRDIGKIMEVRTFLSEHYARPPTIKDLSRRIGINQTKLKFAFREICDQTIYSFILQCRMERARELLESQEHSVAKIAFEVGYDYPANFTNAFKKYYGFLPRELNYPARSNGARAMPSGLKIRVRTH